MSRFVSLSSQKCASGRLARCLQWLEKECEDGCACGMMEVRLALVIARVERIGCGCDEKLDALTALNSLSECDDKIEDQEKAEEMKGRVLACAASFLQQEKESSLLNFLLRNKDELNGCEIHDPSLQEILDIIQTQSMPLLTQAAEIEDPFALFDLGLCYEKGDGVPQDKKKAIELLQKAAEMGNTDAMNKLGVCHYEKGDGVSQDKKKATELFLKASDMGNTSAMVYLGTCYDKGGNVSPDKKKAIELFQRASSMGDTDAMFILGACYMIGDRVPQDKKKAIELYQKAAGMGSTQAIVCLAVLSAVEDDVSQDKDKTTESHQKATDMCNTAALSILAAYSAGVGGVSQNKEKAIELLQSTAGMGNAHALAQLNRQDKSVTTHNFTEDELLSLIQSAKSGDMEAASLLSSLPD